MKRLKNIFTYLAVAGMVLAFTACEDEDKFRIPPFGNGGFVKFVSAPEFNAGANPAEASFNASTEDPNQNVVEYRLSVSGRFKGSNADTIPFTSTTTFPFDVSFTGQDMAAFYNVPIETFAEGDEFEFFASITTEDGTVYNFIEPDCECPTSDEEPDPNGGQWNGGNTDAVLSNVPTLLQALNYTVSFDDP